MQVITNKKKAALYTSRILDNYLSGKSFAVFDIETLGLDPNRAPVILCGLNEIDKDGTCTITQYFAEEIEDEKELLTMLYEKLNTLDYVITYNGRHFDIPYITKRCEKNSLDLRLKPYNLDLYLMIQKCSELRSILPNLKQKTVEEYMGLKSGRLDEISGKESIELYYHYLLEEDAESKEALKQVILLHNHDDVLQLYGLMPVLRNVDIHKAFYSFGLPCEDGKVIDKIKLSSKKLEISGHYYGSPLSYISFKAENCPFDIEISNDWTFSCSMPIECLNGSKFINLNEIFDEKSIEMFSSYPGYINNYLILSNGPDINYLDINMLSKEIVNSVNV